MSDSDPFSQEEETLKNKLFFAISCDDKKAVELLLDKGANPNTVYEHVGKRTPLHLAAYWGYEEVAKLLLLYGADKDATDECGLTPLGTTYHGYESQEMELNADDPLYVPDTVHRSHALVRTLIKAGAQTLRAAMCWLLQRRRST